ncbi:MAG: DMT family transporter [Acidimicrobiia bacterium]
MPVRSLISTAPGTRSEAFGPAEWALLAAIALIWGSSFLFIAIGLDAFRPGLVTFLRLAFGAAALAVLPRARRRVERQAWGQIVLVGLLWMAIPLLLIPIAQTWIDSSLAGMINASMPLFAAFFATVLLRRLPRSRQLVGLGVGFAGVVAIGWPAAGTARTSALGVVLVLAATACYGLAANLTVPLQQRYGSLPVLLRSQGVALAATLPVGLWSLPGSRPAWPSFLAVLVLGVLGTGWAFVAMATLVGRVGAARGSIAIYFLPVVAIVLGVVFRHETVAIISLAGTALVLLGAYLTSRREVPDRRPVTHSPGYPQEHV